jgi:hypothetical protein
MKSFPSGAKFYKPTKGKTGSCIQINLKDDYSCAFLEITSQNKEESDPDPFDWDRKIVMKLGNNDIISLIEVFELVRSSEYKYLLRANPAEFDKWMQEMVANSKDKTLCSLFHLDKNKNSSSSLQVKPNGSQYGGGFSIGVNKKTAEGVLISHRINLSPIEAVGVLNCLEGCILMRNINLTVKDSIREAVEEIKKALVV